MDPRMLLGIVAGMVIFRAIDIIFHLIEKYKK